MLLNKYLYTFVGSIFFVILLLFLITNTVGSFISVSDSIVWKPSDGAFEGDDEGDDDGDDEGEGDGDVDGADDEGEGDDDVDGDGADGGVDIEKFSIFLSIKLLNINETNITNNNNNIDIDLRPKFIL